jgi:hypothetical protein
VFGLPGVQLVAFMPHAFPMPVQEPPWQVSVRVHELLSLHEVPSAFGVIPQAPVPVLQVPSLQALPAQLFGVPLWHRPPEHTSPLVHALPSSQAAVLFWFTQPVDVQLSVVHGLLSSQVLALPPPQTPPVHVSPVVQKLPLSHAVPLPTGTASQVPAASPRH